MNNVSPPEIFGGEPLAPNETARLWQEARYDGLDCLAAQFRTHVYARHTHETYVIGTIVAGCELFELAGVRHAATPGELCFVHPDVVHDGAPADGGYAYRMIYPSARLMTELASDLSGRRFRGLPSFQGGVVRDLELSSAFVRAHRELEKGVDPLAADEAMQQTLGRILLRHARLNADERLPLAKREIAAAMEYLAAHATESVDLATLAKVAGLSRTHLIRSFRRQTGLTPHAFLIDRRIRLARRLLRTGKSAAEVAAETGFADQAHMTRAFKARIGVTPGHYLRVA